MPSTNVPAVQFTPTGVVVPTEAEILAGVQADMNAAFGGNLNANLETSQGQIATTMAAVVAAAYSLFLNLQNNMDPAYSSGRYQDAIGRFYNLTRNPPQATVIQVNCSGATGVVIPAGALVIDPNNNQYSCTGAGTIPVGGNITLSFSCTVVGAQPVPNSVSIYQGPQGWDSATFVSGVEGTNVESTSAFYTRQQQSLLANSNNTNQAIVGVVLQVSGVLSAYVTDNSTNSPVANVPQATITGYIAGTTLTVSSGTMPATTAGLYVSGVGVANGTSIVSGSGPYTVNTSQTVGSSGSPITLQIGGAQINSNSLYISVYGGLASAVAQAIWTKKAPGCAYTGNTTQIVYDTSNPSYGSPGIPYSVSFQTASPTPIFFAVTMKNSTLVPSNALALVQTAITNAFAGLDGGLPAQIGVPTVSSRFNAGLAALGTWAQVLSVQMASSNDATNAVFTGSIATNSTTLTIASFTSGSGNVNAGDALIGVNITPGTIIVSQLTGTHGQTGTYQVSISQTAASATINDYSVNKFQGIMNISQMPTTSAPYISLYLV